jgi:CarD family transcriptional regulator
MAPGKSKDTAKSKKKSATPAKAPAKKTAVKASATSKPRTKSSAAKEAEKPAAKTATKKASAKQAQANAPAAAPAAAPKSPPAQPLDFKTGDFVVYPTHGVGRIQKIDTQEVAGLKLELFVIGFDKDKMILRVPTTKAKAVGMRKLSTPDVVATALNTLKGRARIKRTMWSRRAQEYEAKINSGDLVSIAEVVRDLHRGGGQPEQSYSERQLYEAALARMAREVAAIERIDEQAAVKRVEGALVKKAA